MIATEGIIDNFFCLFSKYLLRARSGVGDIGAKAFKSGSEPHRYLGEERSRACAKPKLGVSGGSRVRAWVEGAGGGQWGWGRGGQTPWGFPGEEGSGFCPAGVGGELLESSDCCVESGLQGSGETS